MDPAPPPAASGTVTLEPGDPAPWFRQRTGSRPRLSIDATAGRYIVLCFFALRKRNLG